MLDYQQGADDKLGLGVEAAARIAHALGLSGAFTAFQKMLPAERLRLDGLVSVWQAQP